MRTHENLWLADLWELPLSLRCLSHSKSNPEEQISNIPKKYINLVWKITMKKLVQSYALNYSHI